jgi:ABC-2 type transport system ATP-binding protein
MFLLETTHHPPHITQRHVLRLRLRQLSLVAEYLRFMAGFYTAEVDGMVDTAVEIAGLGRRLHDKVKTYSKGMTRRLLIARALMMRPKLAILDEPTSGLDVVHAYYIRRIIRQYVDDYGVTVLLSSHNMLEVDFLCTRVALIDNGRIRSERSPADLKSTFGAENLEEVFMEATRRA